MTNMTNMTDGTLIAQRSINLAAATRLIGITEDHARDRDIAVSIAVVNHGGHLVAF